MSALKQIKLVVPEGLNNYMYLLSMNVQSRSDLLKTFIENVTDGLKNPVVKEYMDEYYIYDAKYKMVQNVVTAAVNASVKSATNWNLDFNSGIITIDYSDDKFDTVNAQQMFNSAVENGTDKDVESYLSDLYDNKDFDDETGLFAK